MIKRITCRKRKDKKRTQIALRDGYKCIYCGDKTPPFQIDHVKPLSKGGSNNINNLVFSCSTCNNLKANKLPAEIENEIFRERLLTVIATIG